MKVNVAQYFMNDLAKRFPLQNENVVDQEIIDVLVDRWSKRKYVAPNSAVKLHHQPARHQSYLM